jgi:hypothetical protein
MAGTAVLHFDEGVWADDTFLGDIWHCTEHRSGEFFIITERGDELST